MKQIVFAIVTIICSFNVNAQSSSIWVNDMDHVLGDVKQAFIQNRISTRAEVENLLVGFKAMQVDGIRIPIFTEGLTPNKEMFDYFYSRAVSEGFLIFANPAQHIGGARIACGVLELNGAICQTKDVNARTLALINRVKEFSAEYKSDWISPFNEDGAPDDAWSVAQMNTIYSSLKNNVNGADLIGPDVWGIPASIRVMNETTVSNNIDIAGTHNLGFNHQQWPTFISLAAQNNLPVWDTEVNDSDKFGTGTRLDAALGAEVDGLVLYNSWTTIDLTDGSINQAGQRIMGKYLKFRTDKTYYIDSIAHNIRLASDGESESPYTTSTNTTGSDVEWKFVDKGNGFYHIDRAAGGSKPRLRSDSSAFADMDPTSSSMNWTYYNISESISPDAYYLTLPNGPQNKRLQMTNTGEIKMEPTSSQGGWVSFRLTEVPD